MTIINNPIDGQSEQYLYCTLDEQGDQLTGACCLVTNPEFVSWAEGEQKAGLTIIRMSIIDFINRLDSEDFDIDRMLEFMEEKGMQLH